ncbi:hypothetical protein [Desulfosoma caldarium]|uniref:hypothetical protein n=1 Tax=Desulfosoma caldarium TaxID=610254 RepID=UPI0011CE93A6|nr:hypothetical protein [Desulfosoma caldarium]
MPSTFRSPWAVVADAHWRGFFQYLDAHLQAKAFAELRSLAHRALQAIEALDAFMSRYCAQTCSHCADVCCTALRVAYNVTDLLFLWGLHDALPLGQTRRHDGDPCRYLTAMGCALPRYLRPYVCTWFFCEAHMQLFSMEPPRFQRRILTVLQDMRQLRWAMYETVQPFPLAHDIKELP